MRCCATSGGTPGEAEGRFRDAVVCCVVPAPPLRLQHLLFGTSVFCCWMMWAIIYMAQMNPLVRPVLNGGDD